MLAQAADARRRALAASGARWLVGGARLIARSEGKDARARARLARWRKARGHQAALAGHER